VSVATAVASMRVLPVGLALDTIESRNSVPETGPGFRGTFSTDRGGCERKRSFLEIG